MKNNISKQAIFTFTELGANLDSNHIIFTVLGHTSVDTTRKHYADMTDARRKMAAEHVHLPGDPEFKPGR